MRPMNVCADLVNAMKRSMNNEHIAARLGVTNRQYYRHRNKAIKALLDIIFEMEKKYVTEE